MLFEPKFSYDLDGVIERIESAEFAKGQAQFRLLFQEDGKIAGLSFDAEPWTLA